MEHRPYANDPGLRLLFGDADVAAGLRAVDDALRDWTERLRSRSPDGRFHTRGLQVADYPGPPRKLCLQAYVEGTVTFEFLLARGEFFLDPGETGPVPDGFFLEADVEVDPPPSAPHWESRWLAFSLPETRHPTPRDAVAALLGAVAALRKESERHALTEAAWRARVQRDGEA